MTSIIVNGRFERLESGGFKTYAVEVARRLPAKVLIPPAVFGRGLKGQLWENRVLRNASPNSVLVNLTGSCPAVERPQVTVVHDVLPLELPHLYSKAYVRLFAVRLRATVRCSSALIVPSAAVATSLAKLANEAGPKISVAYPGITEVSPSQGAQLEVDQLLKDFGIPTGKSLVLGINSSVPRKNGRAVLEALAATADQDPSLAVLALGNDGPTRVFGRASRPSHPRVPDLGSVSDSCFRELLSRAEVLVTLSLGEGFGMVPVEAISHGTSVITTQTPSVSALEGGCRVVGGASEVPLAVRECLSVGPPPTDLANGFTWDRTASDVLRAVLKASGTAPRNEASPSERSLGG